MKSKRNRLTAVICSLCIAIGMWSGSAGALPCPTDVCIRIEPGWSVVQPGEVFTVNIVAELNRPVFGWGLDLSISMPGVLSMTADPAIAPPWFAGVAPDGDHLVGLAFPDSIMGENVLLATLTFHADSPGLTQLTPGSTPGDNTEGFPLDPTGFATLTFHPALVRVAPEPATVLLVLLVLVQSKPRALLTKGMRSGRRR